MPDDGLRFLLDQGFPNPRLPVGQLQTNVEYVHLSAHAPELSKKSAPDWMLYLVAEAGGFDGVIAKDFRQVEQPEELIALTRVRLRVITWKAGIDDPVTAWALIVAYMPEIRKAIHSHSHRIFLLPVPRLIREENIVKASARARELSGKDWGTSYPEQAAISLEIMRAELRHRKRPDLSALLDRKEIRDRPRRKVLPGPADKREKPNNAGDPLFP